MAYKKKKFIKRAYSKDTLRNFTMNKDNATVIPDFSYDTVLEMVNSDPVARGALNHFVSKCMEGDLSIIRKENFKYDSKFESVLYSKYNFRTEILRKVFLFAKLYNNAFVEIVKTSDNETKSMNVLNSGHIEPITDTNGDPIRYKSKRANPKTGEYAYWNKSEITWIKYGDRTEGFAPVDLKALYTNLLMKEYVQRYVAWLWKTGQYRVLYNFDNNTADRSVGDFLTYVRKHDDNFKAPFFTKGGLDIKHLRDIKETDSIDVLLKYLDNQTLILLRVPPVDAGIPDSSGRSNADAQSNNLLTSVTDLKKVVEDYINFDLFPKINKSNNLIRFGPADRFAEKQAWEVIQIMKSVGATNKVCKEYLEDRGMFYESKIFLPEATITQSGASNPRDKDMAPSRIGKGTGEGNQAQEEVTTRADQLATGEGQ